MKKLLIIPFLCCCICYAQNSAPLLNRNKASLIFVADRLSMETDIGEVARAYLLKKMNELNHPNAGLTLLHDIRSSFGRHLLYQQTFQGIDVYQSDVKINLDNTGNVLSIANNLQPAAAFPDASFPSTALPAGARPCWYFDGNAMIPSYVLRAKNENGHAMDVLYTTGGTLVNQRVLDLFNRQDTTVKAKVFNPDPLTTAHKIYNDSNGAWSNHHDSDISYLNAQRQDVDLLLTLENDTFKMANQYAVIRELEAPAVAPYYSLTPSFTFSRSQNAFKEEMVLYHISQYRRYLHSIGYDSVANYQLAVDAHASQQLPDNSRFSFSNTDPALFFGIGGVPDPEDADVITHEYTHAVVFSIAPNSTDGPERLAFEEGNADFMATQYSKNISEFNWRWVFNFDGFPWAGIDSGGRNCNSPAVYTPPLDADYYKNSQIWSSMLNDISLDVGRDVTTKLVLGSAYSYINNMTMQDAATLLVQADSVLYGKMHFVQVKRRLQQRHFDVSVSTKEVQAFRGDLQFLNSSGFANGTGDLEISTWRKGAMNIHVYDVRGTLIQNFSCEYSANLSPSAFGPGIYFIVVQHPSGSGAFKVVRY
jgi:hypothetical protein